MLAWYSGRVCGWVGKLVVAATCMRSIPSIVVIVIFFIFILFIYYWR